VNGSRVTLDDADIARLHQVVLGLLDASALPAGEVYLDGEGIEVARRVGGQLALREPSPWAAPASVRTAAPVVVAQHQRLPSGPLPVGSVLLLPTGGVRPDDARFGQWAQAWRAAAASGSVVDIPLSARDAAVRADELATAYSSTGRSPVATRPQPATGGRVVFFTGLSGSGKSTLARALVTEMKEQAAVTLLDGDVVRTHLSRGLGFSQPDRDLNIRRIGWVAAEIAKHGGLVVCAPIAPYDATRRWVRHAVEDAAGPDSFVLVWVSTPLAACEARDVKGLYARARAGELTGFTGIDDPYEPPGDAEFVLDTSEISVADATARLLDVAVRRDTDGGATA
jgi:sulfate adenylyltransferase